MSNSVSRKGSMARNTPQPEKSTASSVHSEKSMRTAIMSPARFSRNQEKTELQNLNNRLAAYIDRVKYLETENSKLIQELNFSEEETNQNVSSIKVLFESELKDLRTAFDDQVKQKNRLELENERTTLKVKELRKKLENAITELTKATAYVDRFNELNVKYDQVLIENKNLKDANKKLTNELTMEKKTVKDNKILLEENILQKVTLENKLQSMNENFKFKEEIYKQQLKDAITSRQTQSDLVIQQAIQDSDNQLLTELQKLRNQYEVDVNKNKDEANSFFGSKIQNLEKELERKTNTLKRCQDDVTVANSRNTELTQQVDNLLSSNKDYLTKINELERSIELQRTKYLFEAQALDEQITAMQNEMSQRLLEYQDLMDIKVALDMEISAYRKLLESEERRLSITTTTSIDGRPRAKKRKLFHCDETEKGLSNVITVSSTSDIEICEVCPDGQFVKLYNKGLQAFELSGYELVRTTTEQNVSTVFKFHSSVNLGAGKWLTVWSSTASVQMHKNSGDSIVMESKDWVVGDLMATILLNLEGQKVATHELKKEQASHSGANEGYGDDETELFDQPGHYQTNNKCIIM